MARPRWLRLGTIGAGVTACALYATAVSAHPVPFSYLDLRLDRGAITGTLVVHVFDAAHEVGITPPESLVEPDTAARVSAVLTRLLDPRLEVFADGHRLTASWSNAEPLPARDSLRFHLTFPNLDAQPGTIRVAGRLFPYDATHRTFLNIYEGKALTQAILDDGQPRFDYYPGTRQGIRAVVGRFLPEGIRHILIGPDHLLFLVGLLLPGGTLGQLVAMVTAFTLAHSITLSLAALNVVTAPARLVEPAIALSIIYVGADNLLIRGGRDVRAWIAFVFGFVHGFGFASVLREIGLPVRALGWSLLSFNVGVEIGQLLVVIVVASAIGWLRRWSDVAGRRLATAGSVAVIAAGAFWFVQRIFFPGGSS